MKRVLFILVLFSVSFCSCAQRNFVAKKLLFGQVQNPYINYGYLYNWYAFNDTRNITSDGWHIPTLAEFRTLADYLGAGGNYTSNTVGGKLKQTGLVYWNTPNTGATNEVGFNARGNGSRSVPSGLFVSIRLNCAYWTTTVFSGTERYVADLSSSSDAFNVYRRSDMKSGQAIRLVKNTTSLSDGQSGTYTGNDGKVYRTIALGSPAQEWLADNLAETKYRNEDWITGYDGGVYTPITDANWAAKTTEAMCVYNDDENNR